MDNRVTGIGIAAASRLPLRPVERVTAEAGRGLVGDRYHGSKHRHLTVQSELDLAAAAEALGAAIDPLATRRNITISGPVPDERGSRFEIGPVVVEVVRAAAPCKLLDDVIGAGARAALRRRGGVVCRVLTDGEIALGDAVIGPTPDR